MPSSKKNKQSNKASAAEEEDTAHHSHVEVGDDDDQRRSSSPTVAVGTLTNNFRGASSTAPSRRGKSQSQAHGGYRAQSIDIDSYNLMLTTAQEKKHLETLNRLSETIKNTYHLNSSISVASAIDKENEDDEEDEKEREHHHRSYSLLNECALILDELRSNHYNKNILKKKTANIAAVSNRNDIDHRDCEYTAENDHHDSSAKLLGSPVGDEDVVSSDDDDADDTGADGEPLGQVTKFSKFTAGVIKRTRRFGNKYLKYVLYFGVMTQIASMFTFYLLGLVGSHLPRHQASEDDPHQNEEMSAEEYSRVLEHTQNPQDPRFFAHNSYRRHWFYMTTLIAALIQAPYTLLIFLLTLRTARNITAGTASFMLVIQTYTGLFISFAGIHFVLHAFDPFAYRGMALHFHHYPLKAHHIFRSYISCLYFSVSTMTTTGFGDMIPVLWYTRLIAAAQQLSGIMFMVGLAVHAQDRNKRRLRND